METIAGLTDALNKTETPREIYGVIKRIVEHRAFLLHHYHSTLPHAHIEGKRIEANMADNLLIAAFCKLPDNRPDFSPVLTTAQGTLMLQWIKGDNAKYVTPERWKEDRYCIAPFSRADRYSKERSTQSETLALIKALEGVVTPTP
jgi:hypothetical protein